MRHVPVAILIAGLSVCHLSDAAAQGRGRAPVTLPDGAGKEMVETTCSHCHGLGLIVNDGYSKQEWQSLISTMVSLSNNDAAVISDYLAALNSRKRKAVKKERREALAGGIEIDLLTGKDLTERAWDAFFRLYLGTTDRKWGSAYLTRRFFSLVGERMPDKIVLVMARRGADYIAGAFNILGRDTIYGRAWGAPLAIQILFQTQRNGRDGKAREGGKDGGDGARCVHGLHLTRRGPSVSPEQHH